MKHIGSFEAKTHLPHLLDRVERGEVVIITRHGRPAARLVPVERSQADLRQTIDAFKSYSASRQRKLGRLSYRSLIDEGRRF